MLDTLKKIGLEETEAKVYLALLQIGTAGASEIARQAGVSRTLCYHGLEKLGWFGLVDRTHRRGKIARFTAVSPKYLVQYVKDKKRVWEKREQDIQNELPKLLDLYKVADKPSVRFQEGVEGMKSIYWETLESKETILGILNPKAWFAPELAFTNGVEYVRTW
jgi:sugar-specific transcriptional regulator TrmB